MRYAYRRTNGLAHDLRAVKPAYVLLPGEFEVNAPQMPTLDSVSDPAAVAAREAAKQAKEQQEIADAAERDQAKQDANLQQILNLTPAQINTFIDNQVTDLAGARTVLKRLARMLVVVARQSLR